MSNEISVTVVGNLTADPELRYLITGVAVATFAVAHTPRVFDRDSGQWRDGETTFLRCQVWRDQAENVAQSLSKGARVIVQGRLRQRAFETAEGDRRIVLEVEVDEVGAALRFVTATVRRATRRPRLTAEAGKDSPAKVPEADGDVDNASSEAVSVG